MKLRTKLAAAALLTLLLLAVHFPKQRRFAPQVSQAQIIQNKYERAQHQTVLVMASTGQGSAVIVQRRNDKDKLRYFAWTACHVVEADDIVGIRVFLRTEGHRAGFVTYPAKVIARDEQTDVALLWISAPPGAFTPAFFASDLPAAVGDVVFACGNFHGRDFEGSISTGVISQIGVDPGGDWPWPVADQSTVVVYPGSSGGPVFNTAGEVLGLVVGGYDATLNVFVPVRAISQWAEGQHLLWAIRGSWCPPDLGPGSFLSH